MKKPTTIILALSGLLFLMTSCDKVEEPYLKKISSEGPGPQEKVKKILLEDYTGHKCNNCPEAAEIAHGIKNSYGEQVVVLAIHAGYYSTPDASGDFSQDFRTTVGNEMHDFFGFFAYPVGMVNRAPYGGSRMIFSDDWESAVAAIIEDEAEAGITITRTYDEGSRKLDCILESEFYEELDGVYNICLFLTESGIIAPQLTDTGVMENYEHNHMLRASLNGTWGEPVGEDGLAVTGTTLLNEYSITLDNSFSDHHCQLVAFIYNTESYEIVQAEEVSVMATK